MKYIGFASSGSEDLFAVLDTRISTQPKIYNIFMIYSWCIHHMFSIYSSYSRHIFTNSSFITYPCDIHFIYPYIYISLYVYIHYIYICYYIKQIQIHKYLYPSYINPPHHLFSNKCPVVQGICGAVLGLFHSGVMLLDEAPMPHLVSPGRPTLIRLGSENWRCIHQIYQMAIYCKAIFNCM